MKNMWGNHLIAAIIKDGKRVGEWDREGATLEKTEDKKLLQLYLDSMQKGMADFLDEEAEDGDVLLLTSDNGHLFEAVLKRNGYQLKKDKRGFQQPIDELILQTQLATL
jgi:hypothetical protein